MNGLLYSDSGEVTQNGECSYKVEHDCTPYEQAIQAALEHVKERYEDMLADPCELYPWRNRGGTNPEFPDAGTWEGHKWWFLNRAQQALQDAIDNAVDAGCPCLQTPSTG